MQQEGWPASRVRKALAQARGQDLRFDTGAILGSMCTQPHPVAQEAFAQFLPTNLGDPGHFPGTARLEREVLQDLLDLFHAPPGAAARYLTGGTEANLLACYLARERTGKRRIVLPESAHFSFEKAARMLGMRLVHVPTRATGHADVPAMAKAMTKDTALVVGVAGTTELGLVDPIDELGAVAAQRGLLLHVDAAYGGYLLPFVESAGRRPMPFDFRVDGVWSLAVDPHKGGMAPIPGGALLVRDGGDWERVAVESPYVSTEHQTTVLGTRPGAGPASCWAVHRHLGRAGYASLAETCLDNAAYLAARLEEAGWPLAASPELGVVTFVAPEPYRLQERLAEAGFGVNVVPRLGAIRIVVNPHVTRPALDRFLHALAGAGR